MRPGDKNAVHDDGEGQQEYRSGCLPDDKLIAAMGKYNEEMAKAGVLLDLAGLQPSAKGARIKSSAGKPTVIDGPFAETKELIAGYWLIQVKSKEEAIEWARRCPGPHGEAAEGEIELRRLFELDDFAPSDAVENARKLEQELAKKITQEPFPPLAGVDNATEPIPELQR